MSNIEWLNLSRVFRSIIPFCITFLLVLANLVPTYTPLFSEIMPILPLISIYHWSIYRPNLLPAWLVFLLGIIFDVLSGTPIGLYALVFLTVYGVVLVQRGFILGKPFMIYWLGYGVICLGASFECWLLASLWHLSVITVKPIIFQYLLSLGVFPPIAWLTLKIQQMLLEQEDNAPRSGKI